MAQDHDSGGDQEETYECGECGETFDTEEELQSHKLEKHDMGP